MWHRWGEPFSWNSLEHKETPILILVVWITGDRAPHHMWQILFYFLISQGGQTLLKYSPFSFLRCSLPWFPKASEEKKKLLLGRSCSLIPAPPHGPFLLWTCIYREEGLTAFLWITRGLVLMQTECAPTPSWGSGWPAPFSLSPTGSLEQKNFINLL